MTADTHEAALARLREAYAALPPGAPVRRAKSTSNLFRFREATPTPRRRSRASPRSATCCTSIPPAGPLMQVGELAVHVRTVDVYSADEARIWLDELDGASPTTARWPGHNRS
jgi:hypothetical protein